MIREAVCVPPNPESLLLLLYSNQVHAGWQKLHVIADNYQLLILTAPKAPAGPGQCAEGARQGSALKAPAGSRILPWKMRQ